MKWKCAICGEVFEGDKPPVPCPVCGAGESAFTALSGSVRWKCTVCGEIFEGSEPPVPCPVCGAGRDAFIQISEESEPGYRSDSYEAFVIVGGGVAALETAKAIRKRNSLAAITMICKEQVIPYNRPALSDVVGDDMSFEAIAIEEYSWYSANKINIICDSFVSNIDKLSKTVTLYDGRTIVYDKLCLAVGANAFNPIKPAENTVPVSVLRTYADANYIIEKAAGKRVLVMGGGILGIEAAVALRERGCTVTICERAAYILANQADEKASRKMAEKLKASGINILTATSIDHPDANGAVLTDGTHLDVDFILASAGVRSELTLARKMELMINRGIIVDDNMCTSERNIYAAGDCAEWNAKVAGLWSAAASQGAVAGAAMTGDPNAIYRPIIPATAFESLGVSFFSCGRVNGDNLIEVTYEDKYTGFYRKLAFERNILVGAVFFGDTKNGAKAIGMIESGASYQDALELISVL